MHFLFKNLVFYSILWGSPSAARGAQKQKLANVSGIRDIYVCTWCWRPLEQSTPPNEQIRTRIWILRCPIFEGLTPIDPPRKESRGGVGEG